MVATDLAVDALNGTPLLIQVEMPALNVRANLSFGVKPSRKLDVYDGVVNLMRSVAEDYEEDLLSIDVDGSMFRLEQFRKEAIRNLDDWQSKLKLVDEWKGKVDKAAAQMNKMRDDYYKELFFLREQVYQKTKAEKSGTKFKPTYATHFDPAEYVLDDEIAQRVAEKAAFMKQEFDDRLGEIDVRLGAKVRTLSEQLMASKMLCTRKDKLVQKLMRQGGYEGEEHVESELGRVTVSAEKMASRLDRKLEKAENHASKEFYKSKAPERSEENNVKQQIFNFLERKFGSAKEVKSQLSSKKDLDEQIGITEFQEVIDDFGYVCDVKQVFKQLSAGQPFLTLRSVSEPPRRPVPPEGLALTGFVDGAVAKLTKGRLRRNSTGNTFGTNSVALGSISEADEVRAGSKDAPQNRRNEEHESASCFEGSDGESSESSETSSLASSLCSESKKSSVSKTSGKSGSSFARVASTVKRASNLFKRKVKGKGKCVDQSSLTEISCNAGLTAAFAGEVGSVSCFKTCSSMVDQGTDPLPFNQAYKKVKLVSRTCQTQIDNRMLDKAMDFYDKVAEDNWNALADIWNDDGDSTDSEAEQEANRGRSDSRLSSASRGFAKPHGSAARKYMTLESGIDSLMRKAQREKEENQQLEATRPSMRIRTITELGAIDFRSRAAHRVASPVRDAFQWLNTDAIRDDVIKGDWHQALTKAVFSSSQPQAKGQPQSSSNAPLRKPGISMAVQAGSSPLDLEENGIQVAMNRVIMLSPFERWIPGDDDPHEIQLQQLVDMAHEIHDRLPELVRRAEKLAGEAKSEREQQLVQELRALQLAPSKTRGLIWEEPEQRSKEAKPKESVTDLLARHGISSAAAGPLSPHAPAADPDEVRHTFAGFSSKASRNGRPSGNFRRPPVQVLKSDRMEWERGALGRGQQDEEPMTVGDAQRQSEPVRGMPRRLSATARHMKQVDNAKIITDRASFRSLSNGPQPDRSPSPDSPASLEPGWSGLVEKQECGFQHRGVPSSTEVTTPFGGAVSSSTEVTPTMGGAKNVQGAWPRISTNNFSFEGESTADNGRARSSFGFRRSNTNSSGRSPSRPEENRSTFGRCTDSKEPSRHAGASVDDGTELRPCDDGAARTTDRETDAVNNHRASFDSMADFGDDQEFSPDAGDCILSEMVQECPDMSRLSGVCGNLAAPLRSTERKNAVQAGAGAAASRTMADARLTESSQDSCELPSLQLPLGTAKRKPIPKQTSSTGRTSFNAPSKSGANRTFSPEVLEEAGAPSNLVLHPKLGVQASMAGRPSFKAAASRTFSPDSLEDVGGSPSFVTKSKSFGAQPAAKASGVAVRPLAKAAAPFRRLVTREGSMAAHLQEAGEHQRHSMSPARQLRSNSPASALAEQADAAEHIGRRTFESPMSPPNKIPERRRLSSSVPKAGGFEARRTSQSMGPTAPTADPRRNQRPPSQDASDTGRPHTSCNGTNESILPACAHSTGGPLVIAPQGARTGSRGNVRRSA